MVDPGGAPASGAPKQKHSPMRTHRDEEGGARTGTGAQHPDLPPLASAADSKSASPYCAPRVAGDGRPVRSLTAQPRPRTRPVLNLA